jgi:hypothetical protein
VQGSRGKHGARVREAGERGEIRAVIQVLLVFATVETEALRASQKRCS